jgi:hypothetical protein
MPDININMYLVDYEPIKSILDIVSRMCEDDRVPLEYRRNIGKALMPWVSVPKKIKPPEENP